MKARIALVLLLLGARHGTADEAVPKRAQRSMRTAAQVLGLGSLALVVGGGVSFGVSAASYAGVRDGCGARLACSADEVQAGKLANGFGWGFAAAGIAARAGAARV